MEYPTTNGSLDGSGVTPGHVVASLQGRYLPEDNDKDPFGEGPDKDRMVRIN